MSESKQAISITLAKSTLKLIREYQLRELGKGHKSPAVSAVIDTVLNKALSK